ncbi:hypothetical protein JOD57_000604 [Geodermatophilus bullaregiensis]|nr:hypothetical protein [Geodermatophilus bullaregiensis]
MPLTPTGAVEEGCELGGRGLRTVGPATWPLLVPEDGRR